MEEPAVRCVHSADLCWTSGSTHQVLGAACKTPSASVVRLTLGRCYLDFGRLMSLSHERHLVCDWLRCFSEDRLILSARVAIAP